MIFKTQKKTNSPSFNPDPNTDNPYLRSVSRCGCLGKMDITDAVLNMATHIYNGCFDYHSPTYGLGFYEAVGEPVTKGRYAGLLVRETGLGTNQLEARFRLTNFTTAMTGSLSDQELDARISWIFLKGNHNVDCKKRKELLPPNEMYWQWTSIDNLGVTVLERRIFECRDFLAEVNGFPEEVMHGYGSYHFFEAIQNRLGPSKCIEQAKAGFELHRQTTPA